MNADIEGALENINLSYKVFSHNGKPMDKEDVIKVLEYGIKRGYNHTGEISDHEIEMVLNDEVCNCGEEKDPQGDGYCRDCA